MEEIKQINSNFPIPKITIDKQGKVLSANDHIGEVFLYEGIVGANVFTLTGVKTGELYEIAGTDQHPLINRNNRVFKVFSYFESDDSDVLSVVFYDVTGFEDLKDRYNDEKPCIAKVQIDNYDELIESQRDNSEYNLSSNIERIIREWAQGLNASVSRFCILLRVHYFFLS